MPQRISQRMSHAGQEMHHLILTSSLLGVCDIRLAIDVILYMGHTYFVIMPSILSKLWNVIFV